MYLRYAIVSIADVTEEAYAYCLGLMSPERRARAERLRSAENRAETVAGELLARRLIAQECGVPMEEIVITRTERGKPQAQRLPVHFSVSHSGGNVLCAVSDSPVGADLERMRPVSEKLIRYVCTQPELAYVRQADSEEETARRFLRIWTGKEAYWKREGTGMRDPRSVSVTEESIRRELTFFWHGSCAVSLLGQGIPTETAGNALLLSRYN